MLLEFFKLQNFFSFVNLGTNRPESDYFSLHVHKRKLCFVFQGSIVRDGKNTEIKLFHHRDFLNNSFFFLFLTISILLFSAIVSENVFSLELENEEKKKIQQKHTMF